MTPWISKETNRQLGSFYFDTLDYFAGILLDETLQFGYIGGTILKVPPKSPKYTHIKTLIESLGETPTEDQFDEFWEQCFDKPDSFSYHL
jgi:hypothetical protein